MNRIAKLRLGIVESASVGLHQKDERGFAAPTLR
jgi:hypothetical protein